MLLPQCDTYEEVCEKFQWKLPTEFNIASAVCDRHADDPDRVALIFERTDGVVETTTYAQLRRLANQWANTLSGQGLDRSDRVAILLPPNPAVPIVHIGCWKSGIISCPMAVLFGEDALEYRLNDSGARVVVTNLAELPKIEAIRERCEMLEHVFVVDAEEEDSKHFWAALERAADTFDTLKTRPEDPAYINYTSGTTGNPKGALAGHRAMLGHMPGIEFLYDRFPQPDEVIWSPADWAWLAGLMGVLMPGLFVGIPVAIQEPRGPFDAGAALSFMSRHNVSVAVLVPTMLKYMRHVPNIDRFPLKLRTVLSGGEPVGADLTEWASTALNANVHEAFGQTECNLMLGSNSNLMPPRPGSIGRPIPGAEVAIVDDAGNQLPPGEIGQIACKRPHPVMLLEYWNNPEATREKFIADWLLTGDLGHMDPEGYFWFDSRADDVITSSGYRIGPGEIEAAILQHPAVLMAAAVGIPDPERTESIKAFIVLAAGSQPSEALKTELQAMLRERLARHEYPREIEFVDSLPMTVTGKVVRRELRQRELKKNRT